MSDIDMQIEQKEEELRSLMGDVKKGDEKIKAFGIPNNYGRALESKENHQEITASNLRNQQFHTSAPWATQ
jgi:hypothetical protein